MDCMIRLGYLDCTLDLELATHCKLRLSSHVKNKWTRAFPG